MAIKPKRVKTLQSLYLEPDRTTMLDKLAEEKNIPKAVLLREAVDDLLVKYKKLRSASRMKPK